VPLGGECIAGEPTFERVQALDDTVGVALDFAVGVAELLRLQVLSPEPTAISDERTLVLMVRVAGRAIRPTAGAGSPRPPSTTPT
jgi:hypothetical protein